MVKRLIFILIVPNSSSVALLGGKGGSARCSGSMSLSSSFHSGSCAHIGLQREDNYCFELNNAGVIQMLPCFER